jgi:hypothetical protein
MKQQKHMKGHLKLGHPMQLKHPGVHPQVFAFVLYPNHHVIHPHELADSLAKVS